MTRDRALLLVLLLAACRSAESDRSERDTGVANTARIKSAVQGSSVDATPSLTPRIGSPWGDPEDMPQLQAQGGTDSLQECLGLGAAARDGHIGGIHLGQRLDSLLRVCPLVRFGYDWGAEAIPEPALQLRWRGTVLLVRFSDTVHAIVNSIAVDGPDIQVGSGARVGMLIDSLTQMLGQPEFAEGECELYVGFRSLPGVGFLLSLAEDYGRDCGNLEPPAGELPRGARVARFHLYDPRGV